jgi:hypothetical protein
MARCLFRIGFAKKQNHNLCFYLFYTEFFIILFLLFLAYLLFIWAYLYQSHRRLTFDDTYTHKKHETLLQCYFCFLFPVLLRSTTSNENCVFLFLFLCFCLSFALPCRSSSQCLYTVDRTRKAAEAETTQQKKKLRLELLENVYKVNFRANRKS